MSRDSWSVNFDTNTYEETISAIRRVLLLIERQNTEFSPVLELKGFASILDTLELKLHEFKQCLPGRDRRRGLQNVCGTILKTLFGTVTINDLCELRNTAENNNTFYIVQFRLLMLRNWTLWQEIMQMPSRKYPL